MAAEHLEVIPGDIGEPNLGLDEATWERLAREVDLIVHPAALVNHVLPYAQLFGPNVVGTAEVIRLAITTRIKPVTYLSTVAVAMSVMRPTSSRTATSEKSARIGRSTTRMPTATPTASGRARCCCARRTTCAGCRSAVFRSDMILAHSRYAGQLNVPDAFTRLLISLLSTGIAPRIVLR